MPGITLVSQGDLWMVMGTACGGKGDEVFTSFGSAHREAGA